MNRMNRNKVKSICEKSKSHSLIDWYHDMIEDTHTSSMLKKHREGKAHVLCRIVDLGALLWCGILHGHCLSCLVQSSNDWEQYRKQIHTNGSIPCYTRRAIALWAASAMQFYGHIHLQWLSPAGFCGDAHTLLLIHIRCNFSGMILYLIPITVRELVSLQIQMKTPLCAGKLLSSVDCSYFNILLQYMYIRLTSQVIYHRLAIYTIYHIPLFVYLQILFYSVPLALGHSVPAWNE